MPVIQTHLEATTISTASLAYSGGGVHLDKSGNTSVSLVHPNTIYMCDTSDVSGKSHIPTGAYYSISGDEAVYIKLS